MGGSVVAVALSIALSGVAQYQAGAIQQQEVEYQSKAFNHWWGTDMVWEFDALPTEGNVPDFRIPYSGHDYPDAGGGTVQALYKYDQAFHGRRAMASEFERRDIQAHKKIERGGGGRGLFGRRVFARERDNTPGWYGHCNGWTAAAIRHAEPQRNVVRNGVVFTPSDIKGLLAEVYMYSESEFLGGVDYSINPATLHVVLANWLGRGSHPLGIETALGEVVINYPLYKYTCKVHKHSERLVEVQMTATYSVNTKQEFDKSPEVRQQLYFHYVLDLDADGKITGGRYYRDSAQIDMMWAAMKPVPGGEKGNERGNPHLDIDEVFAIWRESVPEEIRNQWFNIDPTEEDRLLSPEEEAELARLEEEARRAAEVSESRPPAPEFVEEPTAETTDTASVTTESSDDTVDLESSDSDEAEMATTAR